jgi:phospholipid/cholesterol/gamma-HCH transport system permease protein
VHHRRVSTAAPSSGPSVARPRAVWQAQTEEHTLLLQGVWTREAGAAAANLDARSAGPEAAKASSLTVDGSDLGEWDAFGAAVLWTLLKRVQPRGRPLRWRSMPAGLQAVLTLAEPPTVVGGVHPTAAPSPTGSAHAKGLAGREALRTVAFFGEVLMALGRWLRRPGDPRRLPRDELVRQLDLAGPLSIPIVSLTCALVGLMLAYMGGAQLDRMGAQGYIADVVAVGMVRELAGLMTGIILAGRLGAAYAAQLASMQAGEEVDALRALGLDPMALLVLPRLLALVLVAPLLIAYAAAVGILAGLPAASAVYGVSPGEYLARAVDSLTVTHVVVGLLKGTLHAALIALAGCREGLHAQRNAEAVGRATTRAVVKALVWIVAAACGTTVLVQSMGF